MPRDWSARLADIFGLSVICRLIVTVIEIANNTVNSESQPDRPVLNLPTLEGWKAELTLV